jgi:hypothetical protein
MEISLFQRKWRIFPFFSWATSQGMATTIKSCPREESSDQLQLPKIKSKSAMPREALSSLS